MLRLEQLQLADRFLCQHDPRQRVWSLTTADAFIQKLAKQWHARPRQTFGPLLGYRRAWEGDDADTQQQAHGWQSRVMNARAATSSAQ